jgi:hypothetical protein
MHCDLQQKYYSFISLRLGHAESRYYLVVVVDDEAKYFI